jgi:polar amino acid transport system substrate-binding protein
MTRFAILLACAFLGACAYAPSKDTVPAADLAPAGVLRAAIMYTNPVVASRDAATGELRGVAVDLARELGRRSGLPLQLVGYETAARMLGDVDAGSWDIAFTGVDPDGAGALAFTQAYLDSDGTFLVHADASLRTIADIDREGVRVAVSEKSTLDLTLTRTLKRATLVRAPGAGGALGLFNAGKADVLAGVRQQLQSVAAKNPAVHIMDGRFMVIAQGIALPKARAAAVPYLNDFITDARASGFVAQAIARHGSGAR